MVYAVRQTREVMAPVLSRLRKIAGVVGLGAVLALIAAEPSLAADDVTITVDFANAVKPVKAIAGGFLGSLDETYPPDNRIAPLKPRIWKSNYLWSEEEGANWVLYDRIVRFGAVPQFPLDEPWKATYADKPCADWNLWALYVKSKAQDFASHGKSPEWIVWGEPNATWSWLDSCTQNDYYVAYKIAFDAIRREIPLAQIGGPALADYEDWESVKDWIVGLLDFCLANDCEVNFITWHEYTDHNVTSIGDRLAEIKGIASNSVYGPLNIRNYYIGEIIGGDGQYSPGHAVVTFYNLERGGATGAAKACWPVPGPGECDYNSLDGLLTQGPNYGRRSIWWAYERYALHSGFWVQAATTNPAVAALASSDPSVSRKRVLVGYSGPAEPAGDARKINLVLNNLGPGTDRAVKIHYIPSTDQMPLPGPSLMSEGRRAVVSGRMLITLDSFQPNHAFEVVIDP